MSRLHEVAFYVNIVYIRSMIAVINCNINRAARIKNKLLSVVLTGLSLHISYICANIVYLSFRIGTLYALYIALMIRYLHPHQLRYLVGNFGIYFMEDR